MEDIEGLVEPRQVILVTCAADLDILGKKVFKDNIVTVDWHMPCSFKPFLYAISIGKAEFSHALIAQSHVFCVNFMSHKYEEAMLTCGTITGGSQNKFDIAQLTREQSHTIDCPHIKESIGHLECEVIDMRDCGDHTVFIGKVAYRQLKKQEHRLFHLDKKKFTTTQDI